MKAHNWLAAAGILGPLVAVWVIVPHIHGSDFVVCVAGGAMTLVALWVAFQVAKWVDRIHEQERAERLRFEAETERLTEESRRSRK